MQPTYAHCNSCQARIRLFSDKPLPEKCPQCATLLRYEEFGKCEECKGKVMLGVKICNSCRMTKDPGYSGGYPNTPGTRGGLN